MAEERKRRKHQRTRKSFSHSADFFSFCFLLFTVVVFIFSVQSADFHLILPIKMTGIIFFSVLCETPGCIL